MVPRSTPTHPMEHVATTDSATIRGLSEELLMPIDEEGGAHERNDRVVPTNEKVVPTKEKSWCPLKKKRWCPLTNKRWCQLTKKWWCPLKEKGWCPLTK